MLVRVLVSLAALGGAVIAFVNAGAAGSIAILFGALLAAAAAWGVATLRSQVAWGQVGLEAAVTLGLLATVFVAAPQVFSPSAPAPTPGVVGPEGGGGGGVDVGEPALPNTPLGDFTGAALEYLQGVEFLLALDGPAPYATWDNITAKLARWEDMPSKQASLPANDQAAAFDTWDATKALQASVETALSAHKRPADHGFKFTASPELASDLAAKLRVASDAAKSLEQSIQVYPSGSGGRGR
jgi:hypothetical protein